MNNIQRLQMEIKGIELEQNELIVYLSENGLNAFDTYDANNKISTRSIYLTALHILESLANNPSLMSAVRIDDMTVSKFHDNLMARIDQLERKIRKMSTSDTDHNFFILYN